MANIYVNKKDRDALWEAYIVLDEVQSDVTEEDDIEKYRNAKKRVLKMWRKSK